MSNAPLTLLKIGDVANQSGVPIKTIRYYEELGLLQATARTEGHFRLFHPSTVQRLAFIKRLQSLGLSLQEIGDCLQIYDHGLLPCADIEAKLTRHVLEIDRQIAELQQLRRELTDILDRWSPTPTLQPGAICPNLRV